jgi:hypothetical protein
MNTLNPTVSFNQFAIIAEQDGRIFFGVLQAAKSMASWWLRLILIVFLAVPLLIFAQISPFVFRKHLQTISPVLPYIKDKDSLIWLKDTFILYYFSLKDYKPFCLFRKSINSLMDELDEHIDSLTFALENSNFIHSAIKEIEQPI